MPFASGMVVYTAHGGEDVIETKRLRATVAAHAECLGLAEARNGETSAASGPSLARAELLDASARARFEDEIDAALKRRASSEGKLAGAVRAISALSPELRASLGEATAELLKRGSRQRELCACGLRALSEAQDRQAVALLRDALSSDEAGGTAALSAACFSRDPELKPLLASIAASRQSHLAFGAELARVARGESNGALLAQLAPMIKESHRISMCVELFAPLVRGGPVAMHVGPALTVLREAERHLGRWIVLAEVAVKAGDTTPLEEARRRATNGMLTSRSAWSLVAWALSEADCMRRGSSPPAPPSTRLTLELIARLSDRPSANRDPTFLFRMADARATSARSVLQTFASTTPLSDGKAIRAAFYLARDHDSAERREALAEAATSGREELRGLAAAALWDASPASGGEHASRMRMRVTEITDELLRSQNIGNVAWGSLIRAASKIGESAEMPPLLRETPYRWIQWGWFE